TANQQAKVVKDAQAVAEVQTALTAMGASAVVIQDSVSSGTLTTTLNEGSVSMPVVLKSKGTQMSRVELQKPTGTGIRIVNHGVGVIEQPDGTVRSLLMNNTLVERANHIPALSLLADFQDPAVSVENFGSAVVSNQQTEVVALRPLIVPIISQADWDKSLSRTTFYIDPISGTVVKVAFTNFAENDSNFGQQVEVYLSNYKAVDGVLVPM